MHSNTFCKVFFSFVSISGMNLHVTSEESAPSRQKQTRQSSRLVEEKTELEFKNIFFIGRSRLQRKMIGTVQKEANGIK